ncbi:hypothetical protein DOTSEDRAFT_155389 [Dothistroma septosporum NZE10]|uniref:Uncharacterized protein n=1 Tax=Dothistroma septosporum (strain NZE10 / CBS 128990) TaxID=675120 RepID=N1PLW2_DOTSN|nr:hypothetical protein DOTSEDRAFT_155389 [Dothistroma septosporum NZE10]
MADHRQRRDSRLMPVVISTGVSDFKRSALDPSNCDILKAPIGFLKRSPVFEHEEPYAFRYQADGLEKLTNMETELVDVDVRDLRGQEQNANLDDCGFEVWKLRSSMLYEQFDDPDAINSIYVAEVKKHLMEASGTDHIEIIRVRVRRRHPQFPKSSGEAYAHHQPSTAAHIDTTRDSATTMAQRYGDEVTKASSTRHFKILNLWKPLRGPVQDWPLAVCDARTVKHERDVAEATILHQDRKNHNCQVHFDEDQQWYYLRHQDPHEVLVFRQYDSRFDSNNGVPHSSFASPATPESAPARESVEVMAILYFVP